MRRQVNAHNRFIEYELIQTSRRDLSLKVSSNDVRLFAPNGANLRMCDDFVKRQSEWIILTRTSLADYEKKYAFEHLIENGAKLMYEGDLLLLDIKKAPELSIWRGEDVLVVRSPDIERETLRDVIRSYLINASCETIKSRVENYAPIVGRYPQSVKIREQRTRWGSCSSTGNLNFNWKLIMAPKQALDYVVIHELCHLFELNHSALFGGA